MDSQCGANEEPTNELSLQSLRQLRKKQNERNSKICEEDTRKCPDLKKKEDYWKTWNGGRHLGIATLVGWALMPLLRPVTVAHLCVKAVELLTTCLYLTTMKFPFVVSLAVPCIGIDIISEKGSFKQKISNLGMTIEKPSIFLNNTPQY
jgi:hypothetical protein